MANEPPSDSARVVLVIEHARAVADAAFVETVTGDPRPRVDAIEALRLAIRSLDADDERSVAPTMIVRCTDPDCSVAWAFRDPRREHWHPRPHGPELPGG